MSGYNEEFGLTPEEMMQARDFWDALMFAPTAIELDANRRKLMEVSASVQHAVMTSITQMWLEEYEPRRDENPFSEKREERLEPKQNARREEMIQEHWEQSVHSQCTPQRAAGKIQAISAPLLPNLGWLGSLLKNRSSLGV